MKSVNSTRHDAVKKHTQWKMQKKKFTKCPKNWKNSSYELLAELPLLLKNMFRHSIIAHVRCVAAIPMFRIQFFKKVVLYLIHTAITLRGWLKFIPNALFQAWHKTTQVIEINLIPSKQPKCPALFGTFVSNHLAVLV